jgi:hypothetical protein
MLPPSNDLFHIYVSQSAFFLEGRPHCGACFVLKDVVAKLVMPFDFNVLNVGLNQIFDALELSRASSLSWVVEGVGRHRLDRCPCLSLLHSLPLLVMFLQI